MKDLQTRVEPLRLLHVIFDFGEWTHEVHTEALEVDVVLEEMVAWKGSHGVHVGD